MKLFFFSLSNVSNKLEVKRPCKRRMELDLNRFVFFRQLDKSCSITFMCDIDATAWFSWLKSREKKLSYNDSSERLKRKKKKLIFHTCTDYTDFCCIMATYGLQKWIYRVFRLFRSIKQIKTSFKMATYFGNQDQLNVCLHQYWICSICYSFIIIPELARKYDSRHLS